MTKYQEIENKLLQIDGGAFQNICDAVLYYTQDNFPNVFRSGSQKGSLKTVKGTPDAFYFHDNGKYTFVEYTTQAKKNKAAFLKKVKGDIDKCLVVSKTGIELQRIQKIIYCCTSSLSTKELSELNYYCEERGVTLDFKGIDTLVRILISRCSHVAREFLGVSVDTGQVLSPEIFVEEYESSGLATPLTNQFVGREKEIGDLSNDLLNGVKIVLIAGGAGVGKSKLALEAMGIVQVQRPNTECFCISNKNANIHDDLRLYLSGNKNYVSLIDDANRQSGHLETRLLLLNEKREGSIQLIAT